MALEIEYINVAKLKAYAKNARTHSPDQVAQIVDSINEFGFTNPVLIDENNELIAGHGRTEAAVTIGIKEIPAIRLTGLSDAQKRGLRIADNQLALNAGWDINLLADEVQGLDLDGFDLELLGFDDEYLADLLDGGPIDDVGNEPSENATNNDDDKQQAIKCPSCGYKWVGED